MYTPTQTQPQNLQAETTQASTPNSPSTSADTTDTTQTTNTEATIIPPPKPQPPSDEEKALTRYLKERESLPIRNRYPDAHMSEEFFTKVADFLMYITYRRTEYYKVFNLRKAFSEEVIEAKEVEALDFIGEDGFHNFVDETRYWEKLDAKVKRAYPDATIPERVLSIREQRLVKEHGEELVVKDDEIASLQSVLTQKTEELERKVVEVDRDKYQLDHMAFS